MTISLTKEIERVAKHLGAMKVGVAGRNNLAGGIDGATREQ
jgi:hypothetical protein